MKVNLDYKSKHFSIKELIKSETADKLGINNVPGEQWYFNLVNLMDFLDQVWEGFRATLPEEEQEGFFIRVNSGYRCTALNKAVGGVATSWHTKGSAADITLGDKAKNKALYEWLSSPKVMRKIHPDQVIDENHYTWIHVSHAFENKYNRMQAFHKP